MICYQNRREFMLEKIEYCFPENGKSKELFELFLILLKDLPNVSVLGEEIQIKAPHLKPKTVLKLSNEVEDLQFNIGNQKYLDFLNRQIENRKAEYEVQKLPLKDVANKLAGHVVRVDHTGINLPSILYAEEEYQDVLQYLASEGNFYTYPTGEPWLFLIPATEKEHQNEITNFDIFREPRFELVYDEFTDVMTIQIDIETDLSKSEVEELFPKNQGICFGNLENIFKSVYLDYDENIDIRLDVRFKTVHDDFESGEWFVKEGKRL